ncbi:MAG: ATP-binding cassette domain-containing protein [Halanaerobiaceae bacterium]
MLLFNRVSKSIGSRAVFENLSFNIRCGEFVYIYNRAADNLRILCRLLGGHLEPDSGIIELLNHRYAGGNENEEVGTVFRENILLSERTVQENLEFILDVRLAPRIYYKYRLTKLYSLLGLEYCREKTPKELLPHELKKANIAQALLFRPSILILEEPMEGLDEVNSRAIFHIIEKINSRMVTVLVLTTDYDLVKDSSRRVLRIEDGEVNC